MARKRDRRDLDFDYMTGVIGERPSTSSQDPRALESQDGSKGQVPAAADETARAGGTPADTQPVKTGIQEPVSTENREPRVTPGEGADIGVPVDLIDALLKDHAGLKTGTAKKTTFDFTPEFARALKRWSVDADMSMRDLVVKAVAQAMPPEYLQKYRKPGVQE